MSAGAYGRAAVAKIKPLWVCARPGFGLNDSTEGPGFDEHLMRVWSDTVGDDDPVWILGGLGDPEFVEGLPGRKYLVAGRHDPMSVEVLPPDLTERKQAPGVLDAVERERAALVADYKARGLLAYVWTGYGARYDPHKGILRPALPAHLVVRGRRFTADGCVDGQPVDIDPLSPALINLETL